MRQPKQSQMLTPAVFCIALSVVFVAGALCALMLIGNVEQPHSTATSLWAAHSKIVSAWRFAEMPYWPRGALSEGAGSDIPLVPRMSDAEVALFKKYLSNATEYFEFGCGGSTMLAISLGVRCITSVDTSKEWIQKVQSAAGLKQCLHMQYIPVGELGDFGTPKDGSRKHLWTAYSTFVGLVPRPLDLVLVDGRFRVACALQAWLDTAEGTPVIIHDYHDRPQYKVVEDYFDVVETADTMVVLRAPPSKQRDPAWRKQAQDAIASYQVELA